MGCLMFIGILGASSNIPNKPLLSLMEQLLTVNKPAWREN